MLTKWKPTAKGTFGCVYVGLKEENAHQLVKVIRFNKKFGNKDFLRECRLQRLLASQCLAPEVYSSESYDTKGGVIVMDRFDSDLHSHLHVSATVNCDALWVHLDAQLLKLLEYGYVQYDFKPANVVVRRDKHVNPPAQDFSDVRFIDCGVWVLRRHKQFSMASYRLLMWIIFGCSLHEYKPQRVRGFVQRIRQQVSNLDQTQSEELCTLIETPAAHIMLSCFLKRNLCPQGFKLFQDLQLYFSTF